MLAGLVGMVATDEVSGCSAVGTTSGGLLGGVTLTSTCRSTAGEVGSGGYPMLAAAAWPLAMADERLASEISSGVTLALAAAARSASNGRRQS